MEMLKDQGYRCALSGMELTPSNVSLDHIKPLDSGGTHTMNNVHLVTKEVNRMKSTMSMDEFVGICRCIAETRGDM